MQQSIVDCPDGTIVTGGGYYAGSLTIRYSRPSANGWWVEAESGLFDNDHFTIYVVCLTTS